MTSLFTKKPLLLLVTFFVVTLFLSSDAADLLTPSDDYSSIWSANYEVDPMHTVLDKLNDRCTDDYFGVVKTISSDIRRVVSLRSRGDVLINRAGQANFYLRV